MNPAKRGTSPAEGSFKVYLLHFSEPVRGKRHYIGCTSDLERRLIEHQSSWQGGEDKASVLCREAHNNGITISLTKVWSFTSKTFAFEFEKKLKREGHADRHCRCSEVTT